MHKKGMLNGGDCLTEMEIRTKLKLAELLAWLLKADGCYIEVVTNTEQTVCMSIEIATHIKNIAQQQLCPEVKPYVEKKTPKNNPGEK